MNSNTKKTVYLFLNGKSKLDPIDIKIIELLKKDGRMAYRQIAEVVGKTEATIRRRVKKMLEEGYIKKFTIVVDKEAMGYTTKATIKIKPDLTKIREISNELAEIDQVTDVWRLSGECGFLIRVEIESIGDLDPLIENEIALIEGITISETCFVTKEIKSSSD
ncbi:MAG: DUF977 family protein [Candidatus Lokiarchaeota archaeon]|nr:DUF977 family protein [Candidatus Lokiarchaeota archaeon]